MGKLYKFFKKLMLFVCDDCWCYHSGCPFFNNSINFYEVSTRCKDYRDIKLDKYVLGLQGTPRAHSLGDSHLIHSLLIKFPRYLKSLGAWVLNTSTYHLKTNQNFEKNNIKITVDSLSLPVRSMTYKGFKRSRWEL